MAEAQLSESNVPDIYLEEGEAPTSEEEESSPVNPAVLTHKGTGETLDVILVFAETRIRVMNFYTSSQPTGTCQLQGCK